MLGSKTSGRFTSAGRAAFFGLSLGVWSVTARLSSAADWPMWGGRPDRNMVAAETDLPAAWDVATGKNIRWVASLGSRTYGNPVVAGGKVIVGTNNDGRRNPKIEGDHGVLLCFAEADGRFLWQAAHPKLEDAHAHDWPEIGVCSTPAVVGDRLYYVSNRGELVCLDTEGFHDGENDGPIRDEKHQTRSDADFVWTLDMMKDLGVVPHQASASPPLVVDDVVFVVTGNGIDADHEKVPAPDAPSFLAVDRHTGRIRWRDKSPGAGIVDGQWSGPAYGIVNGSPQVVFPGGDGRLYAFEPRTGTLIWSFDCNAHEPDEKNNLLATPVFREGRVFMAVGQDPEAGGTGAGCLRAIDATKTGDITRSAVVWQYGGKDFGLSISSVALCDGLLYAAEVRGYLHCLDATTGKRLWRHDLKAPVWASPLVADGKVYIGNEDGDITVFQHGRERKVLAVNAMKETVYSTAVAANGALYVADRTRLYAIGRPHVSSQPASAPAGQGWPMFRGNPQLTGLTDTVVSLPLALRWKYAAPDAVESSAAIADGGVYVGCNDGCLYALDLARGGLRWKHKAGAGIRSSPAVVGDVVFFGDDDGVFHAVRAKDGGPMWTFRTDGEIISSPNHADGRILFGSYDGFLYCLRAGDGTLVWKVETEGRVHGTPGVVEDNVLVAGCDERLRVLRIRDGSAVAVVNMGSYSGASASIRGSRVFVGTFGNQVLGIDWRAGQVAWRYEPAEAQPFYSSAAVAADLVILGGRDKLVHAVDAQTGKPRWSFATKGRVDSSPAVSGRTVFVGSADGVLYALDLAAGKALWQYDTGSSIPASPAVGEGRVVVGAEDGTVYCFGVQGS